MTTQDKQAIAIPQLLTTIKNMAKQLNKEQNGLQSLYKCYEMLRGHFI